MTGRRMGKSEQIYRRAVSGEPEAFWELVKPFERIVFSAAFAVLRDPDRTQDVVHDTWVRAFSTLGSLRSPDKLGPWLHSMARNLAHEGLRKSQRLALAESRVPKPSIVSVPDLLIAEEEQTRLAAELRELPEPHREVLALKYVNNLSCQQIADILGIGLEAAKSRLFEARRALRVRMQSADSHAGQPPATSGRGVQHKQAKPATEG